MRPPTTVKSDPHDQVNWSDGSAAWNLLSRHTPHTTLNDGDLLKPVNEWLARADRLDTGYELRRRSIIELPEDTPPIGLIRIYHELPVKYRNENGVVDLDQWVTREAQALSTSYRSTFDRAIFSNPDIEAQIKAPRDPDSGSGAASAVSKEEIEIRRKLYQLLVGVVGEIDELRKGNPPSSVNALVQADC